MDWKEATNDLYKKIAPISGELTSRIEASYVRRRKIKSLWVEFDMNEFLYQDPFYGETKSTSNFKMNVSPFQGLGEINITHIQELENLLIKDSRMNKKGTFSNSLDFSAPMIKFGKITGDKIEFEMEYCLTNSASYGMMTGTINDHIKSSGSIKVDLKIKDMLILVSKSGNVKRILHSMNPNIYDLKLAKIATDSDVSFRDYDLYQVPYKNLKYDLSKKKPWWKFNFN